MNQLLEKLKDSLENVFNSNLDKSELKFIRGDKIDVFKTTITLAKTANNFKKIMEKSAIPITELKMYFNSEVDEALKLNYIRKGSTINDNKVFINTKGLYKYYLDNNLNILDVFEEFDNYKFPNQNLVIKRQEKILILFLLLMGANSEEDRLITKNKKQEKLIRYRDFLIKIDDKLKEIDLSLGREFDWNTGKKVGFRSFIQENNNLPKTGIYGFKTSDISYWLNLPHKRNVSYLIDLLFDEYKDPTDRWMAKEKLYDALTDLSNLMPESLLEVPKELNKLFINELRD